MGAKFRTVFHSLGFRLVLPLFLTVSVVLAVHATLSFRSAKGQFLGFVRSDLRRCSGLIQRATRDGMLLNRKDEVQATLEQLAKGPEVAAFASTTRKAPSRSRPTRRRSASASSSTRIHAAAAMENTQRRTQPSLNATASPSSPGDRKFSVS